MKTAPKEARSGEQGAGSGEGRWSIDSRFSLLAACYVARSGERE